MKRKLTLAAIFLCCVATTFAQFSGSGSGTESDPYLILNPIQLNQIRNFLNRDGVYFKLMSDIDLTDFIEDEYPSQGWLPIGTNSSSFKGVIDGNGKTITGLWINRNSSDGVGFVSSLVGSIKNLSLKNALVKGNNNVGLLAGSCGKSKIENCTLSGSVMGNSNVGGCVGRGEVELCDILSTVEVSGVDCVGGIIGYSYYPILNCRVYSNICGSNYIGGISGRTYDNYSGYFSDCVFIGNISGNSFLGGICGFLYQFSVKKSFVAGNIEGIGTNVGGLAGYLTRQNISDCYFSGNVIGDNNVGGLIGHLYSGTMESSFSNASIRGNKNVGGLCGLLGQTNIGLDIRLRKCVANVKYVNATKEAVGRIYGKNENSSAYTIGQMGTSEENKALNRAIIIEAGVAKDIIDDKQNGSGVSPTTLKLKATYVAMGWDFTDIWEILETESYPYFKTQTAPPVITSQLVSGATTISGKCLDGGTITLDIDGTTQQMFSSGNDFSFSVSPLQTGQEVRVCAKAEGKEQSYYAIEIVTSLGSGKEYDPYQVFTASDLTNAYKKGYYKLMNDIDLTDYINQNSPSEGWKSIGRDGSETIHFDGDGHKITGLWCNTTRDNTGLFSCFANGTIKNLTVETAMNKQVKGGSNTGILIGKMINGTIENCRVSGTVADGTPVGGMVGMLDGGTITLSQASVTINTTGANSYVGGLVGEMTSGEIDQCITLGTLTATGNTSYVGGLAGKNSATVTNCYSNTSVTSSYNAAGLIAYNYGVVDKCYATGDISSKNYGAGVIGYNDGSNAVVKNCVAMNNKIDVTFESQSAQSGGYGQRIIGGIKNGAPAPELNNYALKFMQVSVNGKAQKVYDDIMNGVGKKGSDLAKGSTYQELGWNFTNIWNIVEGYSYPSLKNNAAIVLQPGEDPVEVNLTAPTAKSGLVYNGSAQELITAGSTNVGALKYSLDGSNYGTDIPKGTDAKTYTVYYKVVDSGNKDLTTAASLTVTITPKTVSSPTITLSETSFVYSGQEKKPTVTVKDGDTSIPTSEYTVSYSNNINIGNATVTIKDKEGGNYVVNGSAQFTITAAPANVTAPKAKSGLVYNGSAQELITAGSSSDGTLQYSLDGSNYSTSIPKGTDAKTYTVYYKLKGDANHNDTEPATLTATISPKTVSNPKISLSGTTFVYDGQEKKPTVTVKDGNTTIPTSEYTVNYSNNINVGNATVTISDKDGGNYIVSGSTQFTITAAPVNVTAPKAKSGLVYNGEAQELITAGSSSNGEMQYSLDGSNYSTAIPKGTDAKTYTVYYKVKANANYSDTQPTTLMATISPKTVSNPTITLSETSYVYDGNEKKPTVTVKDGSTTISTSEYTVSYSNNVNVGNATVTIKDKSGGNYIVNGTAYFAITDASANFTAPKAKYDLVYNGRAQELIIVGSSSDGTLQYSLDGNNYSTTIPKGTDAKTYTVYYKLKGDANHNDTEPATLTVTISRTPLKIKVGTYTKKQGEDNPAFKVIYEGFVNNETEAVLTKKPTITCEASKNSPAGVYEVIVNGAEAQNYDISYINGTLTISAVLYKLTYMVDGVVYKTYDIAYGASITPEAEPTKEGYTFSGWSTIPSKMPAEDVVITGTFTKDPEISEGISYEVVGGNASVAHANNATGEIKIDESVVINGKTYQVTAITDGAFQGCTGLTSVEIPSTVTVIGQNAFNGCSGLIIIKIGKGVKEIGSKAFANIATSKVRTRAEDVKLRVYCEAEMIPSTPADAFENTPIDKATLYVPDNLVDVYKLVLPWNGFGTVVGLTTGIDSVTIESTDAFIFDMQGNRLDNVHKGVNIIRTRDGKTKKVVMK